MRGSAKSTIEKSSSQEKYVAEYLGVKRTPRSGGTVHAKGDLASPLALFECKTSMKESDSFTVKREWLVKMNQERFQDRKRFSFLVENFGGDGDKDNYVVMDLSTFKELYDSYVQRMEEEENE